jgi:hypothetical protein
MLTHRGSKNTPYSWPRSGSSSAIGAHPPRGTLGYDGA